MGKTAFLFPGQGAQYAGMGKDFYDDFQTSREIYDKAEELLSMDIKGLCFNENINLNITRYTQPAMAVTCLAILAKIKELGMDADYYAGLSLGEYPAVIASGAISFEEGIPLIKARGELMESAVPEGKGGMAAVLGLDTKVIEEVLKRAEGTVAVANYNCPGQTVISGDKKAVAEVSEELIKAGAKRVLSLNVSGPFHSPMLKEAGEKLSERLKSVTVNDPVIPYVTNINAGIIRNSATIKDILSRQVYSPVRWEESVRTLLDEGVDLFVEIGPGKTLAGFIRKIDKQVLTVNVEKTEDLNKLKEVFYAGR
ncbi:ACP S-malonyltransferase [Anaerocolumna xylanovorans]|uniref:Malonyl CoA-acyl carrier protein transacylase n=1 Tax=Anaerocolumna xylanovorans DSM 12503 TaxID=1121345 RepID=A0A1M7YGV2_9FIRM|nr:ACP S-malonyltransferase [Anaerocolumna xylanovorans]SHO51865.1 [acyl-carrier-protein] S-malonyltransferase [Anaerocolumna xylanovorans DSM 12503]